jgi:ABC-2 type transport system permease protein
LARWQYPTPLALDLAERIHAEAKAHGGHASSPEVTAQRDAQLLKQYGVTRVEDLPLNTLGLAMQAGEEYSSGVADRHYASLWNTFRRQNGVYQAAAIVAPLLSIRSLSMGLAGTDWEQNRHFIRATELYRRQLVKSMNEDLAYHSRTGQNDYQAGPETWARLPEFTYQAPGVGWVLQRQAGNVAVLALWCAAMGGLAYGSLRRLQVQ